jgi:hypothetical protein
MYVINEYKYQEILRCCIKTHNGIVHEIDDNPLNRIGTQTTSRFLITFDAKTGEITGLLIKHTRHAFWQPIQ